VQLGSAEPLDALGSPDPELPLFFLLFVLEGRAPEELGVSEVSDPGLFDFALPPLSSPL
jgi:hypothetical protein